MARAGEYPDTYEYGLPHRVVAPMGCKPKLLRARAADSGSRREELHLFGQGGRSITCVTFVSQSTVLRRRGKELQALCLHTKLVFCMSARATGAGA
jgi:hypothetical protein